MRWIKLVFGEAIGVHCTIEDSQESTYIYASKKQQQIIYADVPDSSLLLVTIN